MSGREVCVNPKCEDYPYSHEGMCTIKAEPEHRVVDLRLQPVRMATCKCGRTFSSMERLIAHRDEQSRFPTRTEPMTAKEFLLAQVPHEFKPDWSMDNAKARFAAREAAHQAVKAFDLAPNIQNTTAAIEALAEYEQHLKEEMAGG